MINDLFGKYEVEVKKQSIDPENAPEKIRNTEGVLVSFTHNNLNTSCYFEFTDLMQNNREYFISCLRSAVIEAASHQLKNKDELTKED